MAVAISTRRTKVSIIFQILVGDGPLTEMADIKKYLYCNNPVHICHSIRYSIPLTRDRLHHWDSHGSFFIAANRAKAYPQIYNYVDRTLAEPEYNSEESKAYPQVYKFVDRGIYVPATSAEPEYSFGELNDAKVY